jgi:5-methyltetrahydropteroyltriglutamate--homocysteine methyltransferase
MLNAIPERFRKIKNMAERYFTMARGNDQAVAMEMTKWFNTNYHYIVPELEDSIEFQLNADKIFNEYQEAKQFGIKPKINIIGPITFIGLSKTFNRKDPYDYFDKVVLVYKDLLFQLSQLDKSIVLQIEEPILVKGLSDTQRSLVNQTYKELALVSDKIRIIVTTYFEHACEAVEELADTGIWGIGLDFVYGKKNLESLKYLENMVLVAGVVDGRNIWISNYEKTIRLLEKIAEIIPKKTLLFQPVVRYFMCHIH